MREDLERWINTYHWCYALVSGLCRWRHGVELTKAKYLEIQRVAVCDKPTD